MIVYHVIGANKLKRCLNMGYLYPPVRGWKKIESAERFSKQTGRSIILRLKFPDNSRTKELGGHKGEAVYINGKYDLDKIFGKVFE
jgi:hypothetical protein